MLSDYQIWFKPNPRPLQFSHHYLIPSLGPQMTTDKPQLYTPLGTKLAGLFNQIVPFLSQRDAHYESSWKKRGGQGAFNTIARPWDRFEAIAKRNGQDIFKVIQEEIDQGKTENDDGTLQACVRDLLSYMALLMVETSDMRRVDRGGTPMKAVLQDGNASFVPQSKHYDKYGPGSVDFEIAKDYKAAMELANKRQEASKWEIRGSGETCEVVLKEEVPTKFIFPCVKCHSVIEVITTQTVRCPVCQTPNRITITTND